MIKESIPEENTTSVDKYTPDIGAPKYIRQILKHKGRDGQKYNNSRRL